MKVLLFANIGTAPNGFYHVGDEAMFLETYNWYQKHHPNYKLSILTSQSNHSNLKILEIINPFQFQFVTKKTLIQMFLKLQIIKLFKINIFNKKEQGLYSIIKSYNRIHFCGGGNITSLFSGWLYYSLLIIITSINLKKEVILTSQTLGPFKKIDKIITKYLLNKTKIIAIREYNKKIPFSLDKTKVFNMLDAAYTLPIKSNIKIPQKKFFRIGLSLHDWKENQKNIDNLFKVIKKINSYKKIEIVLIPHVIVNSEKEWDMGFMNSYLKEKENFKIIKIKIEKILSSKPEPAYLIKKMTSTCDLLISTRYHGLIFALSKNIPTLTLIKDEYYSNKNINALKFYYHEKYKPYLLNINESNKNKIYKKTINLIKNNKQEKKYLSKINNQLKKKYNLFFNNLHQKIIS